MILKKGSRGDDVRKLQLGLSSLAYDCGTADGIFGQKTEDAVEDFQAAVGLYEDGVAGPGTIRAYNAKVRPEHQIQISIPDKPVPDTPAKLKLVTVPCDKMGHNGFTSMRMRSDAAERFRALRAEALSLGGGITTAGSVRPLSAGGGAAQSSTSLHYCGIAWDLALGSGMQKTTDAYLIENLGDRRWRVWMKCVGNAAIPTVTVQATICSTVKGKTQLKVVPVTGQYVDFTALAAKHGWFPIRGRKSFYKGGSYSGSEWWHWQQEGILEKGVSTFGGELLKVYDEATIKANFRGDWNVAKGAVWGVSWF